MLKLLYRNHKVEVQFSDAYTQLWRYPPDATRGLQHMNAYLRTATSFRSLADYRPFHLERLSGKLRRRKGPTGEWSIKVGGTSGYRVLLIPCDDQGHELTSGDIMALATRISVIKITEVTNHYE